MTDLLLVYVTCESLDQAEKIGKHLLNKKLCACINIIPEMKSIFFWPPKSNKIDQSKEVILIAKTLESKYQKLEDEIERIHSYQTPCVIAILTRHVNKKYYDWIKSEIS